jgi:hypothetical protein
VVIANLTPVPRLQYRVGLPRAGLWRELVNSDAAIYGGSNMGNGGAVMAVDKPCHKQPFSAEFILPPLSILVFRPERAADKVVAEPAAAPEKLPEKPPGAKQVAAASVAVASPAAPALETDKAFYRIPDTALKALDAAARAPAGTGGASQASGAAGASEPLPPLPKG